MLEYRNTHRFQYKVLNFPPEVYRIDDESSHIFKIMYTLLQLGLGQLVGWQDEAENSESMPGTMYNDLDAFFAFLGIVRNNFEIYAYDPYHDQLTHDQWNEVYTKDALFRIRIMKFFQAILRGGTMEGIQMAAEAASGVQVQVFEMWRVLTGAGYGAGVSLGRDPLLEIGKEFVIVPLLDEEDATLTPEQRSSIIHLVDIIKPVNTICTVRDSASLPLSRVVTRFSASEDYWFEVRRMVSANDDLLFQDPDVWIQPNSEVEGPTFALMDTNSVEWSLNESVDSIKAFRIDDNYLLTFGILDTAINDTVETFVVDEADPPLSPAFPIRIDDEEMFVTDRVPVPNEQTKFTYTVLRAQNGTTAASHLDEAEVHSGTLAIYSDSQISAQFTTWASIPLADSPDNFSQGKYSGDPSKFDTEGNYLFDYDSQPQYVQFFTQQIQLLGGEVDGTKYRVPVSVSDLIELITAPEDALAAPELDIQPKVFPSQL